MLRRIIDILRVFLIKQFIIPRALVGYEMIIANSYPTCTCGIIVKYHREVLLWSYTGTELTASLIMQLGFLSISLSDRKLVCFRFVYKFVCDLKNLLGYSAGELSRLVLEAEETANELEPGTNGGH